MLSSRLSCLAIDTECTGTKPVKGDRPYFISTVDQDATVECWRFEVDPKTRRVILPKNKLEAFQAKLSQYDELVFHNAKFDISILQSCDIEIPLERVQDILIASHVHYNRGSHKLKDLADQHLGLPPDDETELIRCIGKARNLAKKLGWVVKHAHRQETEGESWMKADAWIPGQIAKLIPCPPVFSTCLEKYGIRDVERTLGLWFLYRSWFMGEGKKYYAGYLKQLESLQPILEMEKRGFSIKLDVAAENLKHYSDRFDSLKDRLRSLVGDPEFNPGSPKQLQKVLFEDLGLPILKRTKTGASTDYGTLVALHGWEGKPKKAGKFLECLLASRKCGTVKGYLSSYVKAAYKNRVHSSFNPTGTDTTRLSSSDENLQNVGKGDKFEDDHLGEITEDDYKLRENFGPLPGRVWIDADYEQLQLRIFAVVSGEPRLQKAFADGWDAHNFMACQVFKTDKPNELQRRAAKAINFGFIFGAQVEKIIKLSGDPGTWDTVNRLFPNATKYLEDTKREVNRTGYIDTGGVRLYVPTSSYSGGPKGYTGVVYRVQGLEGLIVKRAMFLWQQYLAERRKEVKNDDYCYLSLQVHDELIADYDSSICRLRVWKGSKRVPQYYLEAKKLKELMEQAGSEYGVATPASISLVTDNWASKEDLVL